MRVTLGDLALVVKETCGHQFVIGSLIKIDKQAKHGDFYVASNKEGESWYMKRSEFFLLKEIQNDVLEELTNAEK